MNTASSILGRLTAVGSLALLFSALFPVASSAVPATYTWTSNAAGTWDTASTTAWSSGAAWNNGNNDTASFSGATYTVSIAPDTAISVGGITVASGNAVTLNGGSGSSLTLAGTHIIGGSGTLILETALGGSAGLTKTGGGILNFKTAANYTGDTSLGGGQISLAINDGLPTTTKLTLSTSATFSMQSRNQSLAGLSGTAGTVRSTSTGTSILTVTGGTGTFSGNITSAGGAIHLGLVNAGTSNLTLNGATLSYTGATSVTGGTLTLGSNLSGTSAVSVGGGTLASNVANVNLGVGDFTMTSGALSANGTGIGSYTLASTKDFTASGGTLDFTLGAGNTSDTIFGSGLGSVFNVSGVTLALDGTTSVAGTYTLFSGFAGGSVSDITITGLGNGLTGTLLNDGTLVVSSIPEPSTYAVLAGIATLGLAALRRRSPRA